MVRSPFDEDRIDWALGEALAFLRRRFEELGGRSGLPVRSLSWALDQLDQCDEALAVYDAALARRPDDGNLALFAAEAFSRFGRHDRARELLDHARDRSRGWARVAARHAEAEGRPDEAMTYWRRVLEVEPLAIDAHEEMLRRHEKMLAAEAHGGPVTSDEMASFQSGVEDRHRRSREKHRLLEITHRAILQALRMMIRSRE